MKKIIYLTALIISLSSAVKAQWINNIQIQPAAPTTTDTVLVLVSLSFPSGNCDQHTQGFNINGYTIEAFALHCLGMLTYICNHTDTFKINPLPAGPYKFRFELNTGMLPFPCTPGIMTGISDSTSFVISPVTGFTSQAAVQEAVSLTLDENILTVFNTHSGKSFLYVFDQTGKLIFTEEIKNGVLRMDVSYLSKGTYLFSVSSEGRILKGGTFIK